MGCDVDRGYDETTGVVTADAKNGVSNVRSGPNQSLEETAVFHVSVAGVWNIRCIVVLSVEHSLGDS